MTLTEVACPFLGLSNAFNLTVAIMIDGKTAEVNREPVTYNINIQCNTVTIITLNNTVVLCFLGKAEVTLRLPVL